MTSWYRYITTLKGASLRFAAIECEQYHDVIRELSGSKMSNNTWNWDVLNKRIASARIMARAARTSTSVHVSPNLVHLIGRNSSIFLSIPTFISIAAGLETTYSWLKVRQMYQRFSRPPSIMVAQCTVWTTSCIVIYRGSTIVVRMNDLVTLLQHIHLSGSEAESAKKRCWRKKGNSKRDKKNYGFRLFKGTEKWATSDFGICRQKQEILIEYLAAYLQRRSMIF